MENLNNLKLLLYKKKVTARQLAEHLGVSTSTVTKWNSNVNQPEAKTVKRICEFLGVSSTEFYNF